MTLQRGTAKRVSEGDKTESGARAESRAAPLLRSCTPLPITEIDLGRSIGCVARTT